MPTSDQPRRLHNARICTDCLQEFPQGRGYDEHDCPGRPARPVTKPAAVSVREQRWNPMSQSYEQPAVPTDTEAVWQIIDLLWSQLSTEARTDLIETRPEVAEACRVIHNLLVNTQFPKLTANDPVKLANCAPECRFLETRQHTPDCQPTSVL